MKDFFEIHDREVDEDYIKALIDKIYTSGAEDPALMEEISHYKIAHPDIFRKFELNLLSYMGLFYKKIEPKTVKDVVMYSYAQYLNKTYGITITPVQANILEGINNNVNFSFSAPTSAGKSYIFRELIKKAQKHVVIVLPSRALIAEYILRLRQELASDVIILQFVDEINTMSNKKRVFVITPERSSELFSLFAPNQIDLFLFDEAQLTESDIRGAKFDALIRHVSQHFFHSKLIFAQPFIDNPEVQILKHKLNPKRSKGFSYKQQTVGKIFVKVENINDEGYKFSYFSPYNPKMRHYDLKYDLLKEFIVKNKSVLIYSSKQSIKNGEILNKFRTYFKLLKPVEDEAALNIIKEVEDFVGHYQDAPSGKSFLVRIMKRGIVYHHGSMPLRLRALIEHFVREGYSRVCFATSTLIQGINMPFNLVWIKNFTFRESSENIKSLALKNLIGRAGRNTENSCLDIGLIVVEGRNISSFSRRLTGSCELSDESILNANPDDLKSPLKEYVTSINENRYDMHYDLPQSVVDGYKRDEIRKHIKFIIDNIIPSGKLISIESFFELEKDVRDNIRNSFRVIYERSINEELSLGEYHIFRTALDILLSRIRDKSLKHIVYWRCKGYYNKRFLPVAQSLPNRKQKKATPLFRNDNEFDYDTILYDTYDYIDKVWGQSLAPYFIAAFSEYYNYSNDNRADLLVKIFKYGTTDQSEIWMQRYGFSWEDIEWLKPCVKQISAERIEFNSNISSLSDTQKEIVSQYMEP